MTRILYPILTEPVLPPTLVAEEIHPDAWVQPLSLPQRFEIGLRTASHPFVAFVKADPFPEAVTADRWVQPLSIPARYEVGLRAANQPSGAFVKVALFPETVSADRWAQPLSLPQFERGLRAASHPYVSFVEASPFPETVTADRWFQPLAFPQFERGLRLANQPYLSLIQSAPFAETVSADRWFQPLSLPQQKRTQQPDGFSYGYFVSSAIEIVTVDKWYRPFIDPVRQSNLSAWPASFYVGAAPFPETVTADRWFQPLAFPKFERGLRIGDQPYLSLIQAAPFSETVSADRWFQPLSQPSSRAALQYAALSYGYALDPALDWYQPLALPQPTRAAQYPQLSYGWFTPGGEIITVDKWLRPLAEPIRQPNISLYPTLFYTGAAPFPEAVTADRWYQPFSRPERYEIGLRTGSQPFLAAFVEAAPFAETVSADRWFQPLSIPLIRNSALQHQAFSYGYLTTQATLATLDWLQPLALPLWGRVAAADALSYGWYTPSPPPPTTLPDGRWHLALSDELSAVRYNSWPAPPLVPELNEIGFTLYYAFRGFSANATLVFIKPSGQIFKPVNVYPVALPFGGEGVSVRSAVLAYVFGRGELSEIGTWAVYAATHDGLPLGGTAFFDVVLD